MITFNQKGKCEYQILCDNKEPLYISLLPNNTISNKFDSVMASIKAMSETIGKVFDDFIFNLISDYQNCDNEKARFIVLENNTKKAHHFSKVFVNLIYVDYAKFANQSEKTKDSIFFDSKDIENFIKLSHALKIYSILLNTEAGIGIKYRRIIYDQFITLLKADYLPSKLHEFLKILSIKAKKNNIIDEDDIDNLVLEADDYILYKGLITHDYKRNPILFFIGIFNNYIKYGGKYKPDMTIEYIDDNAKKMKDPISREESDLQKEADKITLNRLYDISLFYLSNAYGGYLKTQTGNVNYPKFLKNIKYTSPFWDAILAPLLPNSTGIRYEKLIKTSSQQAAAISFYSGRELNFIFNKKYKNLFRLAFLFPINQPEIRKYRLKNVSQFIDTTLQFPTNNLSHIGGSRIFITRLIEDFIGKIKSTPFRSIYTGHLIKNIQIDKIEIETIDYIVRYFTSGLEGELKEFETVVSRDIGLQAVKRKIEKTKKTLRNKFSAGKKNLNGKSNLKSKNNENIPDNPEESKIDQQSYSKQTKSDPTPIPALIAGRAGRSNKNKQKKKSKKKGKSAIPKKYERAYQTCKDTTDLLKNYLKLKPNEVDQYLLEFQRSYDLLSDNYKAKVLNYANKTLSKNVKIVSKDGSLLIGELKGYSISVKEGRISKEYLVE